MKSFVSSLLTSFNSPLGQAWSRHKKCALRLKGAFGRNYLPIHLGKRLFEVALYTSNSSGCMPFSARNEIFTR